MADERTTDGEGSESRDERTANDEGTQDGESADSRVTGVVGPHDGARVRTRGPPLAEADAAVVTLHGRDATPAGILGLTTEFDAENVTYLAPAAADRSWYPGPLVGPATDETHLESALAVVGRVVARASSAVGRDRVGVFGFSQGGCLAAEWLRRNPTPYGGVAVLSGGLLLSSGDAPESDGSAGEPPAVGESLEVDESLAVDEPLADGERRTPILLGCSDADPHVPVERVHATRETFERLGGTVDERLYDGLGHAVTDDELAAVNGLWMAMIA